jgi:competence protein ComEC
MLRQNKSAAKEWLVMRAGMLALVLGLLALGCLPVLPAPWCLLLLALVGVALLSTRAYPLAFFLFGLSWACTSAQMALDDRLAAQLDNRTLWLEGQVVGLPELRDGVLRFQLAHAQSSRAQLPTLMRLSWRDGPALLAGEHWRLAVQLRSPLGSANPRVFDYEAWLLAQRIGALGSVKAGKRLQPAAGLSAWRDQLRQRLLRVDAFGREGALAALVLGDGSGLSRQDWQLLQTTGTVHLLVISGQQIALLAGLVYALVVGLARRGWWPRRWPWLPCACVAAFAVALAYGLLAGFDVPVQRACVMVGLVLLWRLRFAHLGVGLPLLLALNGLLLAEPLASLQAGFWLSFAAVGILALVFAGRLGAWSWWLAWWRAQWSMALGLLPLLLALALPISRSSPLANLLAVPWLELLVTPLALLGTLLLPIPWLGEGCLWLAGGLLQLLFLTLGQIAGWLPAWLPTAVPLWAWLLGMVGALIVLLPAGVPWRGLGILLMLPLFYPPLSVPAKGEAQVWQWDVGQGMSVLVRTQNHNLLYDAGPKHADFDLGERIVLPALRGLGVNKLDLMLLSHADMDHSGGALALARGLPIAQVLSGEAAELPDSLTAQPCIDGAHWQWDGVSFSTWRWQAAPAGNPSSCVLLVEAQSGERLLLTGDIEKGAERALLERVADLRADWLQAPHHGSLSSSSMVFLRAVAPRAVLISRGRHNAYGHPHPRVLARYQALGVQVYDNVPSGALRIQLGRHEPAQGWREQRRFWR